MRKRKALLVNFRKISMKTRKLGNSHLEFSTLGLGCMGVSFSKGPPPDKQEMILLLRKTVESGIPFF